MCKNADHQSLMFSERGQLSQAILQFRMQRKFPERTSIARFELQRADRSVYETTFGVLGGRYDRQWSLAIQIMVMTLAGQYAITVALDYMPHQRSFIQVRARAVLMFPFALPCLCFLNDVLVFWKVFYSTLIASYGKLVSLFGALNHQTRQYSMFLSHTKWKRCTCSAALKITFSRLCRRGKSVL